MDDEHELKPLNHFQLKAAQQKQKEARDTKYREKSKKRLVNIISTKINYIIHLDLVNLLVIKFYY